MPNTYTVAQVNAYIKNMFKQDFMMQRISIKGEVSNCKYHSSGHIYFTLKDPNAAISCVMFKSYRTGLSFPLKEGQQIVATGTVEVYEKGGSYQLYAHKIELDGIGALYERFARLKAELEEQGMFDTAYKQPIPKYIKTLGVVTAPTGAAVRDIIQISTRRNPYVQIILYPAIVQGVQAVGSIVNGIKALEMMGVDTIIVGRGGGSIEDLWAFNEEPVAQAIFDCSVPIISAVGHETDTTIADYVADLRAPTPSAAAELAVWDYRQLNQQLQTYEDKLWACMQYKLQQSKSTSENLKLKLLYYSPQNRIREKQHRAMNAEEKLQALMDAKLRDYRHRMELYIQSLKGLSPLDKLNQGLSFATDNHGRNVHEIEQVKPGQTLRVFVRNGVIHTEVIDTETVRYE